jgi:small-conductance mechanosensitive channel
MTTVLASLVVNARRRAGLALGALLVVAALAGPVLAQAPSPPQVQGSSAELEALSATLRDEAKRAEFLKSLDALIAARRATETPARPARPGLSDRVAQAVSERVGALASRMTAVLSVLRDAPRLVPWLESQVMVPAKRDRLIGLVWRFLVIVGIGMAVQFGFRKLTDGARRNLEKVPAEESMVPRALRFTGRMLMLYLNAFAYAGGAYAAYVALPITGPAAPVLLVGVSAFFVAKLILATARVFLSPGVAGLRPGYFSDETAQYLYIWVRRLVRIFVYAFFLLEAVRLVGLPEPAHDSLLYLVGLAFVGFLIVFVLQNRAAVADAIRGAGGAGLAGGARARIAGVWHIAAFAYIAAVYLVWLFKVKGGFEYLMIATGWTVLILVLARLALAGIDSALDRIMRIGADMGERLPGLEARANRYMTVLRALARWTVGIFTVLLVMFAWGVDTLAWLGSADGQALIEKTITIVIIALLAMAAWEAVNIGLARHIEKLEHRGTGAARIRTLMPLVRTTVLVLLVTLVALIVLSEIGINIAPLLAGAGVLGLAIGFGSQKLVQDVITGLFILVEDTLEVGDVVQFDTTHAGVVEALSIRTVRLRDLAGNVHVLPFSEVKTVINKTKDWAYYVFDVGIAYRENVDHVIGVLREIGADMQKDDEFGPLIAEPLEILGLDKFADSAVIIKARIKVVPPGKQWAVGREFNRRMKARFDAEGIEIPFPHQTVYFGEDRSGRAPAVHVAMSSADKTGG